MPLEMMSWERPPRIFTTKPMPQASRSFRGWYRPAGAGKPWDRELSVILVEPPGLRWSGFLILYTLMAISVKMNSVIYHMRSPYDTMGSMDFTQIQLFRDIVPSRSISRGAAMNGVTQSAASQALQELERQLGARLL